MSISHGLSHSKALSSWEMGKAVIEILGRDFRVEVDAGRSLAEAVAELGLRKVEYIPTVNGEAVTWDYILREGDHVKLVPVVSGGASCQVCGGKPVYNYLGRVYCREHFIEYFENRVLETIEKYGLVKRGEHIAVAVSGGKDSLGLLHLLMKYRERLGIDVTALLIDEGIKGYRDLTIEDFHRVNNAIRARYRIISYKEVFGYSLDEILEIAREKGLPRYPCSYCGVFRRYLINVGARIVDADKLATGHNLDDMIQTYVLNIVTNSLERILHLEPMTESADHPLLVTRIKPFYEVMEMETTLYALLNNLYPRFIECVYAPEALRNDIRNYLNELEEKAPGSKYRVLDSMMKLIERYRSSVKPRIRSCKVCGEPTSQEICRTCRYLDSLSILDNLLKWRRMVGLGVK